jgi:hypothetical protein
MSMPSDDQSPSSAAVSNEPGWDLANALRDRLQLREPTAAVTKVSLRSVTPTRLQRAAPK